MQVFTCDTGSDLANVMLTAIGTGRGGQLPDWTGVSLERDGIVLLRPLREFTEEELIKYLDVNGVEVSVKLNKLALTIDGKRQLCFFILINFHF